MIKYKHFRTYDENEQVYHKGGATLAYEFKDDETVVFAVARCRYTDNFNRKLGRAIAANRLKKNIDVYQLEVAGKKDITSKMYQAFVHAYPQWTDCYFESETC